MASTNLRWLCAPLLFVSSVVFSQGAPDLPPIFTQYVVPYDDLIATPRGDGACVAGYVEAICSTGGTNQCFSYKEDDGNYYMRVRSTGYYCGSWSDYNDPQIAYPDYDYENIKPERVPDPPDDWELSDLTSRCSEIYRRYIFYRDPYGASKDAEIMDFSAECYFTYLLDHDNLRKLDIHELQILVSNTRNYVRGFNDYMIDSLNSKSDKYVVDFLDSRLSQVESDIKNSDIDIQDILNSIQSLNGGLNYAFERISTVQSQLYDSINDLQSATNDRFSSVYSDFFSEVGNIYGYIDENNAGIASSIDSQTGEITGAIDGQTSALGSKLDGISFNLFDFLGKFDSFSDYIKGKIGGFEDSLTDGLPSDSDVAAQTGELSSLIDDKDFSRSYSIEFGAKQCPEPISVYMSTLKRDIEISFELFCQFADIARLFVLASAYIMALMITMGVSRRA